ncbi:MAG: pyridoxamine 5'-phosphate oxidase family protein [bacterium]|nr:pyridoxamine 5'-phosphate oxidase family protein [bacterium]
MRRDQFQHQDDQFFLEVAHKSQVGYLALYTDDGYPRSVALNFVALNDAIYFHGALAGEKFEVFSQSPKVGFTMAWELSYIPSNWTGPLYACPATQLFKSVEIRGTAFVVQDVTEKALALQALMEKHQDPGTFRKIDPEDKIYKKVLGETGVFRVKPDSWTGKMRLFEEKPREFLEAIINKLREQGSAVDLETVRQMERIMG